MRLRLGASGAEKLCAGSVKLSSFAAGAGRHCAPTALIGRRRVAPQLHR
jgi:hypothetical protein